MGQRRFDLAVGADSLDLFIQTTKAMKTQDAELDYDRPFELIVPEDEMEAKVLQKAILADLPEIWYGHTGDARSFKVEITKERRGGRYGLRVTEIDESNNPLNIDTDLEVYTGFVYALRAPNGDIETGFDVEVDGETTRNIAPSEPVLA